MPEPTVRERSLTEILTSLHEHFSATARVGEKPQEYRRGHAAGMAFARLCVLDQLAVVSATSRVERDSVNRHRRESGALQAVAARLDAERAANTSRGADVFGEGYRAGIMTAATYIVLARDALDLRGRPADPVSASVSVR